MRTFVSRLLWILFGSVALFFAVAWVFGFSPRYIINAPSVAAGIGAKLSCSMRYVMNLTPAQATADIESYSPILKLLNYHYDDEARVVTASFGPISRTASWHPEFGCGLDYADHHARKELVWLKPALTPAPWPAGNEVHTINANLQAKLDALLLEDNAQGHDTRALLVVHNGTIVAESYAPGFDSSSKFLGWSMAKSVTNLMVGQLEMLGKLRLDETALFANWQDSRAAISIRHLLNMTDGLAYDEIYLPGGTATAMLFQSPSATEYMLALPLRENPGETHRYASGSTVLLSALVQHRWAENTADAIAKIAEHFFKPFALHHYVFEMDADGLLMGSSYLYASARDWAKLGLVMLNGGEINGTRIVSEEWIQKSLESNPSKNDRDFGMHWWLNKGIDSRPWPSLPENSFVAQGNREQRVFIVPDAKLVIVRLGWSKKKYRDNEAFKTILDWFAPQ